MKPLVAVVCDVCGAEKSEFDDFHAAAAEGELKDDRAAAS
jgi:hypothetical protein